MKSVVSTKNASLDWFPIELDQSAWEVIILLSIFNSFPSSLLIDKILFRRVGRWKDIVWLDVSVEKLKKKHIRAILWCFALTLRLLCRSHSFDLYWELLVLVIALTQGYHAAVRHVFAKLPKWRRLKTKKISFW